MRTVDLDESRRAVVFAELIDARRETVIAQSRGE
jgi:hypothetical protein